MGLEPDIPRAEKDSPETEELSRLFKLYRLSSLNLRYSGARAAQYGSYAWWLHIAFGAASALALGMLLLLDSPAQAELGRQSAAVFAGIAALSTVMGPITGWANKANRLVALHAQYLLLFGQIESVMINIRRDGISDESYGGSKLVHEAYRHLEGQDEPHPDQDLIDREDKKVRDQYLADYPWTHL